MFQAGKDGSVWLIGRYVRRGRRDGRCHVRSPPHGHDGGDGHDGGSQPVK